MYREMFVNEYYCAGWGEALIFISCFLNQFKFAFIGKQMAAELCIKNSSSYLSECFTFSFTEATFVGLSSPPPPPALSSTLSFVDGI